MEKATDAQIEERVNEAITLLIKGASRRDILQHFAKTHNVSTRTADYYIADATDFLVEEAEKSRRSAFGKAVAAHRYLYKEAMKNKDYAMADRQLDRINNLYGNYAPAKQVNMNFNYDAASIDELREQVRLTESRAIELASGRAAQLLEVEVSSGQQRETVSADREMAQ